MILHTRALTLLSDVSVYVPERHKEAIEQLAEETRRTTMMPVRVERRGGMVFIDPLDVPG